MEVKGRHIFFPNRALLMVNLALTPTWIFQLKLFQYSRKRCILQVVTFK